MKIVFVGLSGVPYSGRACDLRLANTANMLATNTEVVILNRYSTFSNNSLMGLKLSSNVICKEVIKRRYTNGLISKFLYLLSVIVEPYALIQLRRQGKINWLHVYSGHYTDFLLYKILARLIGAKIVYEYVEYRTEKQAKGIYHKINNYLCDFHGAKLWDACISISNFLTDQARKVNDKLPIIKITPIGDFELFESNNNTIDIHEPYIMFCGHAGYYDVVKLIIDSYNNSQMRHTKKLLLVLGGNDQQINKIRRYCPNAIVKTKLPYEELIAYYKHAYALMIPLRNSIEDIARFPNKICEYTAAHGLIVTTNVGEMKYYFKNGENAIVADEFSISSIAKRLNELENGKYDIEKIRENAYITGIENFSIDAYKEKLYKFLNNHE